eukprot:1329554-Pleurochrysis_carterae.AAC.2
MAIPRPRTGWCPSVHPALREDRHQPGFGVGRVGKADGSGTAVTACSSSGRGDRLCWGPLGRGLDVRHPHTDHGGRNEGDLHQLLP